VPRPSVLPESLVAQGRYWRARRAARPLPAAPHPLAPEDAELHLRIAEGLGDWAAVEGIVERVPGRDTLPQLLLLAARGDERARRWGAAAARYSRVIEWPRSSPASRAVAAVRLAVAFERLEMPDSAAESWRRAALALPLLADWFALHDAEAEQDTAVAFAEVAAPRSPGAADHAADLLARRRVAAGNLQGALQLYLRRGRLLEAARLELQLGRAEAARSLADTLLAGNPYLSSTMQAADFLVAHFPSPTPVELLEMVRAYRERGDLRSAERYAARAATATDTGLAAWIELAGIAAARRRVSTARAALRHADALLRRRPALPTTLLAPLTVRVLGAARRWSEADSLVHSMARAHPGDSSVAAALLAVADHARLQDSLETERSLERILVRDFRDTRAGNIAAFRIALAFYAAGMRDSAEAGVAAVVARDSTGALGRAARYWGARLAFERGDRDGAAALHAVAASEPFDYYGVRAYELLGLPLTPVPDAPFPSPRPVLADARAAERVHLLATVGLDEEAKAEALGWLTDPAAPPDLLAAVAAAAGKEGFGREAILLGAAAHARGSSSRAVARALFPVPYWQVIEAEAAEQCVDPLLMAAIIRQESRFQRLARSRAGARGLSQLLPSTARELSRRLHDGRWDPRLLDQPDFNLHLGALYLRRRMAGGPLPMHVLIASYNAGPVRIARWSAWPRLRDPDLFIGRLSISETREYVRRVYANYAWYRRLYRGAGAQR
jgi:soluble lytic murein transglycosylase